MDQRTQRRARRRIALYSHDTQGLGHIRRNIAIASALVAARPDTDVLLLTGSPEAASLPLPANTEIVTLPTVHKDAHGDYSPGVLGVSMDELLRLRGLLVSSAVSEFRPDLFIVDKVARGIGGDLDRALRFLRRDGGRAVLGLRDVLDSPDVAVCEWTLDRTTETIREHYDEVWVYGDPVVYDPASAYQWPAVVRERVAYTGYLAEGRPTCPARSGERAEPAPPGDPYVLCLLGGGQDGADLADSFLRTELPDGYRGVLLTGPYLAPGHRERLHETARQYPDKEIHGFTGRSHEFIAGAAATVSMGGYNSVCELLAARCPTLVVPRTSPRTEQAVRADALARLGWVDTVGPTELTAGRIGDWLNDTLTAPDRVRTPIDLDGLARIPRLADSLLEKSPLEVAHHAVV